MVRVMARVRFRWSGDTKQSYNEDTKANVYQNIKYTTSGLAKKCT